MPGGRGAKFGGGSAVAGELGRFIKQTGGAPGSIHEHPEHGGVKGKHSPNSYHYSGRAIDIGAYAYEQGDVINRIKEFNQKMGVQPVEFLHAGNDANHQDHVHVAYAGGIGNGMAFNTMEGAQQWERSMVGSNVKVASVTANSGEMGTFGATFNGGINVTVNADGVSDPKAIAYMVAREIQGAVEEAVNANIIV